MRRVAALGLFALAWTVPAARAEAPAAARPALVSDGRYAMGTVLEITLVAPDPARGRALLDELYAMAARLEAAMTLYDAESALSRLNRAAGQGPQRVEPDLARVLADSIAFSRATRGSFDVTVGPLIALWRAAGARGSAASADEIAAARALTGVDALRVDAGAGTAELRRSGASVDLGGVAKGWALDRMVERLRAAHVASALLSFGQSSLWALGAPPGEDGWRLLVRQPDGFAGVATLRDRAASVSGSLGQWTEIDGLRYGHVIDPRSGQPLLRAATAMVLAPTAAFAEALSKALLVLQPAEGIALLEAEPGCEGLLVDPERQVPGPPGRKDAGDRFETRGWQAATRWEPIEPGSE